MALKIDQALVELLREDCKKVEAAPAMPKYAFLVNGKAMRLSFNSSCSTDEVKTGAQHHFGYLFPNSTIKVLWSQID